MHPKLSVREMTPLVSTRCMDALTRSYCTLSPLFSRRALIIRYPEWGCLDMISLTHWSNSSLDNVLYSVLTERSNSSIRLYSVLLEIPKSLAIEDAGKLISRSCCMWSEDTIILWRPAGPCSNCTTLVCPLCLSFSWLMRLCNSVSAFRMSADMGSWLARALNKTKSWVQVKSKKSISRGSRSKISSKRDWSLCKRWCNRS